MRADARANRDAVVTAALELIPSQGTEVPLSTVASTAGVGIATLYRHFPTREDLLLAVVHTMRDRVLGTLAEHGPAMQRDPERAWPGLVGALADLQLGSLLPQLAQTFGPKLAVEDFRALRESVSHGLDVVLDQAKGAGLVREDVTAVRFHLGLGMITRPLPPIRDDVVPEAATQREWMIENFLRGLRP